MIQEFLTALNGVTGDIFVEDEIGNINIVNELPFVIPSEKSLMNEMCVLGTYYRRMQNIIQSFSNPLLNKINSGLYKISLSYAVMAALDQYRNDLLMIQKEFLIDPCLSLSFIKVKLNDYYILFPTLWKILDSVNEGKLSGCQVLNIIFKSIPAGNYKIKTILLKILNRCNNTFFKQLSSWLLRGALYDPYNEFLIEAVIEETVPFINDSKHQQILIDNMTKLELKSLVYGSTNRQRAKHFQINEKNIPCFIPFSLANKILFIGESVHFFDKNNQIVFVNDWTYSNNGENQLTNELYEKFGIQLNELKSFEEFNLLKMQELIENLEKFMMKRIWGLLVEENGFLEEFYTEVKDFLLLGRGELFMVFITNVEKNLINCTLCNNTEALINYEFLKSSRAVFIDNEEMMNKFKFVLNRPLTSEGGLKWEDIDLTYKVRWPFHIVFTQEILKNYSDLFRFLVRLKRTQMKLNGIFSMKKLQYSTNCQQWQLRNHMSFFVNNLQYYIQVDVIESQISIFNSKVRENKNIDILKSSHENFVHSLKSNLFMFNNTIFSGLLSILDVCMEYVNLMNLSSRLKIGDKENSNFHQLQERFHSLTITLYNILNNVEGHSVSNPHLRQLLAILDFNSFFSVLGAKIGSLKKSSALNVRKFIV